MTTTDEHHPTLVPGKPEDAPALNALAARSTWKRIAGIASLAYVALGYTLGDAEALGIELASHAESIVLSLIALLAMFSAEEDREYGEKRLTILGYSISLPGDPGWVEGP